MRIRGDFNKFRQIDSLCRTLNRLRLKGKKIVFTNGCFDILHRGHIEFLKSAKSLGDILVVALNSDNSVKKIKGKGRPINPLSDRAVILSALEFVDYITVFDESTPKKVIGKIRPDILTKGADWSKDNIVGRDVVESYGGQVMTIRYLKGYSTTKIINRLKRLTGVIRR